jgi:hypothetical protein
MTAMARSRSTGRAHFTSAAWGIVVECLYTAFLCAALFLITMAISYLFSRCRA